MKSESNITRITLFRDKSSRYFAEISLQSGQIQCPSWKGLKRYWLYAKASDVEYLAASYFGHYAVFCFTIDSGQGGIIGIWNTFRKRWEQVSEGNYVVCAMILDEIKAVISLHFISCWGVPGYHAIFATPINRTLDGFANISLPINVQNSEQGFDAKVEKILKAGYGDFARNEHGPLGIFLLDDDKTIVAHDAGNLFRFSVDSVVNILSQNKMPGK